MLIECEEGRECDGKDQRGKGAKEGVLIYF